MHSAHASSPKAKSLIAFALLMLWVPIVASLVFLDTSTPLGALLTILPAVAIIAGFIVAVRIKCSSCHAPLSKHFPYKGGGAVLLWAAQEQCPECGVTLGWK